MNATVAGRERVSIRRLKDRVRRDYRPDAAIRQVLAVEPDELDRAELLSKLPGWVILIREAERGAPAGESPRRRP